MNKPALLPNGFMDLLPDDAEQEAAAVQVLMDHFGGFGYRRIKPPLVEFEDSLLAPGPGAALAKDTFRVMDSVSHQMMGIRADSTPQISRIVCTRLKDEKKPLRLSYANDVLRMRAGQLRSVRQFCQVGCEMIGDDCPQSTVELVMMAVLGLKKLGVESVTLDFAMPRAFDLLCPESLGHEEREALLNILMYRDQSALAAMDGQLPETLLALLCASGSVDDALPQLMDLDFPQGLAQQIEDLKQVSDALQQAFAEAGFDDVAVTVDPFETKGSGYYKGLAFSLFSRDVRGELGRGGHYAVCYGGADTGLTATGFTLYMDTIRQVLKSGIVQNKLAVLPGVPWDIIQALQDDGWITVLVRDEAEARNCADKIYKDGAVTDL